VQKNIHRNTEVKTVFIFTEDDLCEAISQYLNEHVKPENLNWDVSWGGIFRGLLVTLTTRADSTE
jgi:hypothetical protein